MICQIKNSQTRIKFIYKTLHDAVSFWVKSHIENMSEHLFGAVTLL